MADLPLLVLDAVRLTLTVAWKLDLLKPKAPVASLEESASLSKNKLLTGPAKPQPEEEMAAVEGLSNLSSRTTPLAHSRGSHSRRHRSAEVAEAPPAPAPKSR